MAKITRIKAQDQRQKHQVDEIAEAEVVTKVKASEAQAKSQATGQGKNKAQAKASAKSTSKKSAPAGAVKNTKTEVEDRGEAGKASKNAKSAQGAQAGKNGKASKTGKNAKDAQAAKAKKSRQAKKPRRTPAILKPFAALGGYVKASWAELRQVRWPSRKATWKLTLAVIVYCVIFILLIMGLDLLFGELFGWLLG